MTHTVLSTAILLSRDTDGRFRQQDPRSGRLSNHHVAREVARRLSVTPGQELEWIGDGMGGFRVVSHTTETVEALAVHEEIMAEYDAVFRVLAK